MPHVTLYIIKWDLITENDFISQFVEQYFIQAIQYIKQYYLMYGRSHERQPTLKQ